MKVCYFGTYESDYPRNRLMIEGLRKNGVEVVECHCPLWEKTEHKTGAYLSFSHLLILSIRVVVAWIYLTYRYFRAGKFDIFMVGYIGQMDLVLAKVLNLIHRRPLVFNPLISLYDTLVLDRKIFSEASLVARILYYLDRWSFALSDIILLDTETNIRYFIELFDINPSKFMRVPVGADEELFHPEVPVVRRDDTFQVLFYGKFIPLHGIQYVLYAAKLLEDREDIVFQVVGKGQLKEEMEQLSDKLNLKNVRFLDWVNYENLPSTIAQADACLGIFGRTEKAGRVIPNKVFQCLAMGRPVLTRTSPASLELLTHGQNVLLCEEPFDVSISAAIVQLKENAALQTRLSMEALRWFREGFISEKLVAPLVAVLQERIDCASGRQTIADN